MGRHRPPSPSVVVSVAVDKALADASAALYVADIAAGLTHAEAVARGRLLTENGPARDALVEGLEHARTLDKKQHSQQLENFRHELGEKRLELQRAHQESADLRREIVELRRENARLSDPRRERE